MKEINKKQTFVGGKTLLPAGARAHYQAPRLTAYGSVADIVKTGGGPPVVDAPGTNTYNQQYYGGVT